MRSTFSGLSIGISGLYANKRALDTVSHNIANVNNPNYVRQQVIQSSSLYYKLPSVGKQIGSGVDVQTIRQIRDEFLDVKYRSHTDSFGYWSARNSVFEQVQEIINEVTGDGVQKVMDQFWNSWGELAKDPDNLTIRGLLKERAVAFVETVNHIHEQLDSLQVNLNRDIKDVVSEINNIGKNIADLNSRIIADEVKGIRSNDNRDARNALIDRLSQLVNIEYYEENTGAVTVSIGGKNLVSDKFYSELSAQNNGSSYVDIYWKDTLKYSTPSMVDIRGGELKGLIDSRGDVQSTILDKNNGSVNQKVNIDISYDTSNLDIGDLISKYEIDINKKGFSTGPNNDLNITKGTGFSGSTIDDLIQYVKDNMDTTNGGHNKFVIVTNNDITIDDKAKLSELKSFGASITVVSDTSTNWKDISDFTGGSFFDIDEVSQNKDGLALDMSQETTNTASKHMGAVSSYNEIIPSIKQRLNAFVNTIARNINYLHSQGTTITGNKGEDFFVAIDPSKPIEAGNIKLNDNLDTLNNIAASETGDRGNGKIAERIVQLREMYLFGEMNSDNYYRDIISDLGVAANESLIMEDSESIILGEIDGKRKSISSVSLDEEMADMIKYQHSYVASSRVINAIDEMIENIINRMGVVGR